MKRAVQSLGLVCLCLLAAALQAEPSPYVDFKDEHLRFGRAVWMGTCENCHGYGVADSPIPMQPEHWRERVGKQRQELYNNAINGYFGPDDSYMPERGGNPELSDEQVKQAVDYMVNLAEHSYLKCFTQTWRNCDLTT